MFRMLPVCAALLACAPFSRADDPPAPADTIVRLSVYPAAVAKPALRYQLLPELREINPGNPILGYLKSFMEQNHFWFRKDAAEKREKWLTMPLRELPLKEMAAYGYGKGAGPLTQVDYAARLERPDWQILPILRRDGFNTLVPDVQQMRPILAALHVRARCEMAEKRLDDALVTLKTMFAMGRHLGDHPTLIGNLVGFVAVSYAADTLDELLAQPGCPNLFWALRDLPSPLVDLRTGLQGERMIMAAEFGMLAERTPMTEEQIDKALGRVQSLADALAPKQKPKRDASAWVAARAKSASHVSAARQRLVDLGLPPEDVKLLPARQVVLLAEKRSFEAQRDDVAKLMTLPFWQAAMFLDAVDPAKVRGDDEPLFAPESGRIFNVRRTQVRAEQRLAILTCVEALRLYAADHDRKLPARLADIELPLPVDPVTGQPFAYDRADGVATIRGTAPNRNTKAANSTFRYEVRIAQ